MESTITPAFALQGLLVPTAKPVFHPVTRNHVEMVVLVLTRMAFTHATALQAGLEASVNRLLTGVEILHVKMVEDVLKEALLFTATVERVGLARCVMYVEFHVKQQHV